MIFKAIIFDFIGTTVIEKDPAVLNRCFVEAFKDHNADVAIELVKANRGKDKKEMIGEILSQSNLPLSLTEDVLHSFRHYLKKNLSNFCENEGATDIINFAKEKNILTGLGTGLPRDIFETIFEYVGWSTNSFDYIGIAEETGKGRPHPDMLFDMMKKLGLTNKQLLKTGDTIADIQEGKNAGVMTAAILSGTQDEKEIIRSQPDFIIRSLKELKPILSGKMQA